MCILKIYQFKILIKKKRDLEIILIWQARQNDKFKNLIKKKTEKVILIFLLFPGWHTQSSRLECMALLSWPASHETQVSTFLLNAKS